MMNDKSAGSIAGAERLQSRVARAHRAIAIGIIFSLLAGGGAAWGAYHFETRGWLPHQKAIAPSAFKRFVMHSPWGGFTLQPADLLPNGQRSRITYIKDPRVLDAWLHRLYAKVHPVVVSSAAAGGAGAILGLVGFIGFSIRFARIGDKHKRGARLVSKSEIKSLVKKTRGRPTFEIAGIPMPFESEHKHFLMLGTTGAGKSQGIEHLLEQARAAGDKVLLFDPGAEFLSKFHQSGDVILNPFDIRSANWNPISEIETPMDADAFAMSAIQANAAAGGDSQYFYDGARAIMAEALKMKAKGLTHVDIGQFLLSASGDELESLLQSTPAGIFVDQKAKGAGIGGIRSTLQTRIQAWQYLQRDGDFSVRDWVRSQDSGWLFLTSIDSDATTLEPLISLWVDIAAREILSREPRSGGRIWIVIDELASLQKLPSLLRLLSMGRKYRSVVLLATQSPSQLATIYKKEGMQTIFGTTGTKLISRLEEPDDAELASKHFGDAEIERDTANENASKTMRGNSYSTSTVKERVILPAEVQSLPDLAGFLKLAGGFPACRVQTKYKDRPQVAARIERRDMRLSPQTPVAGIKGLED